MYIIYNNLVLKSYKNSLDNNKSQSLIEYNNNNKKNV
jgi:hypothetical protein